MTNQDYVGKAMRARINLDLPTKHKVAPGETFRYLQAHADGGASAVMWLACGQVELLGDDVTIPLPASPVGPKGRRRERAAAWAPVYTDDDAAPLTAEEAAPEPAHDPDLGDGPQAQVEGGE